MRKGSHYSQNPCFNIEFDTLDAAADAYRRTSRKRTRSVADSSPCLSHCPTPVKPFLDMVSPVDIPIPVWPTSNCDTCGAILGRYVTWLSIRHELGLVTKRCPEVPECTQGGSLWPGRALERQRMTRAARVAWAHARATSTLPEGLPKRRPRMALSRVSDPPGLGRR